MPIIHLENGNVIYIEPIYTPAQRTFLRMERGMDTHQEIVGLCDKVTREVDETWSVIRFEG